MLSIITTFVNKTNMAKSAKLKSVPKAVPVYSSEKSYTWKADDVFAISGLQLDIINKVIQANLQDPSVQRALFLVEGAKAVQEVLKLGVEEGIAKEAPKPEPIENQK